MTSHLADQEGHRCFTIWLSSDATNQTVPSSASVNKLSSFPITSEGRYIPVFGSKKSTVSSKKISNGMTQSQVTLGKFFGQ